MCPIKLPDERYLKALANFLECGGYNRVILKRKGITIVAFRKIMNPDYIEIKHFLGNRLVKEKTIINGLVVKDIDF